jgi:hypothetical protein
MRSNFPALAGAANGAIEALTTSGRLGYRREACLTFEGWREKTAKNTGENALAAVSGCMERSLSSELLQL